MSIENKGGHKMQESSDNSVEVLWSKSQENLLVTMLVDGKSLEDIVASIEGVKDCFKNQPESLGCSDGRITEHRCGCAGSSILAGEKDVETLIQKAQGKIKEVTSHDGCGAAAIKFKQMKDEGILPGGVFSADELGKYYSARLAEKMGIEYRHITSEEMSGSLHDERAVYVDGTGKLDLGGDLPPGFICSGPSLNLSSEYLTIEIATLTSIALGDHGFGGKFTEENPFYVLIFAEDKDQLSELKSIAQKAVDKFDGRVVVDGVLKNSIN